jgi:hypothetical protein
MDMNEYALEVLTRARLSELRATRDRVAASRPLRVSLGGALVRLGRRLQGVRNVVSDVERDALTRRSRTA